jgi:hypothetical protein
MAVSLDFFAFPPDRSEMISRRLVEITETTISVSTVFTPYGGTSLPWTWSAGPGRRGE